MSWIDAARARLSLLFRGGAAESRMNDEMRFHIEQETERIAREHGVAPVEARRRALVAFGGLEKHKEELRATRGGSWIAGLSLDLKLGLRMLVKYPGLTVVGILGMAVGVAIGATGFAVIDAAVSTRLPFDGGERVIGIQNLGDGAQGRRLNLHDLAEWRATLRGVELFGAYRTMDRNLIAANGAVTPFRIVEMNASGFTIVGAQPILGRYLSSDDERLGAPPVVVIGHKVWERTFFSDSAIVGKTLKLGDVQYTIVGVMPRGFAFPINNSVWTPLKLNAADYAPGRAPAVDVFAKLRPGTKLKDVNAQVQAIGTRRAAANPSERKTVTSRAVSYANSFFEIPLANPKVQLGISFAKMFMSLILIVVGTNVAILVYARTASRTGEIGIRTALGASRWRIVGQFFAEALVLSCAAAAVGLVIADYVLRYLMTWIDRAGGEQIPFWITLHLSVNTVLYIAGLAVLAAVIVGVLPALKATQRRITAALQQLGTGGSGLRLGKFWSALIVAQVAATVSLMPIVVSGVGSWILMRAPTQTIPVNELLTAALYLDRSGAGTDDFDSYEGDEFKARFASLQSDLVRALRAEPTVASVTFANSSPGAEGQERVAIDSVKGEARTDSAIAANSGGRWMLMGGVEHGHLAALGIKPLAGRLFEAGDATQQPHVALVNRSFVRRELGDGNALGRRIRPRGRNTDREDARWYRGDTGWYEIVGVVPDIPYVATTDEEGRSRVYAPMRPEDAFPVTMTIRTRGTTPAAFAPRLREITARVNPMLRLGAVEPLAQTLDKEAEWGSALILAIAVVAVAVLLLSAAGIYALMSFTVSRRRREIGIRAALGAGAGQVVRGVLARATGQIALGIAIGLVLALPVGKMMSLHMFTGWGVVILPTVVLTMTAIGLAAAAGPARRAMQIQPTEALRAE
jgi:predicted permease